MAADQPSRTKVGAARSWGHSATDRANSNLAAHAGHDFSLISVHSKASDHVPGVQKKSLNVTSPTDPFERQAEEVSRKISLGQSAEISKIPGRAVTSSIDSSETTPEFQARLASSKAGGHALDESTLVEMQSKMGFDLRRVRVHTDSEAHALNEKVDANAFTHGRHIYFRRGAFNGASPGGKALLAHELVHTQQQAGGHRAIQRQVHGGGLLQAAENKRIVPKSNISKTLRDIIAPKISKRFKNSNVTVEAKVNWEIGLSDTAQEVFKTEFLEAERKLQLDEHFYSIALSGFSKDLFGEGESNTKAEPGMSFVQEGSLQLFKTELEGTDLEFKLAEATYNAGYKIDQQNVKSQSERVQTLLGPLVAVIENGKMSLNGGLEISVSVDLKPSDYLKKVRKKIGGEKATQANLAEEKKYRNQAKESQIRKNEARLNKNKLEQEIRQKTRELDRIRADQTLTPEKAMQKIEALEKEIPDKQFQAQEFEEAWKKEKAAMDEALASAREEKKAARKLGRELKHLDSEIADLEKRSSRFKRRLQKLEQLLEKQRQRVDKIVNRLAEKAAKWLEKKAARWVGQKLAVKVAQFAAGMILRAIPLIGEFFLLWDALTLVWEIASALWDRITGEEANGAEPQGADTATEKTGDAGQAHAGSDAPNEGQQGLGTVLGTPSQSPPSGIKGVPPLLGKGQADLPVDETLAPVKTKPLPVVQTGRVGAWTAPPSGATAFHVGYYEAVGLNADKNTLVKNVPYPFILVIYYQRNDGTPGIIQCNAYEWFEYVGTKDGRPRFQVYTPFTIQTADAKIFFAEDFPISLGRH